MYYSNVYWPYAIMFFKNGGACEPTKARDQNPTECLLLSLLMSCFQCPAPAWPAFLRIVSFFGNRGERWAKHCEASGCGEGSPHQDAMPRLWTCEQHRLEDAWSDWSALQISPDMEWHGISQNDLETTKPKSELPDFFESHCTLKCVPISMCFIHFILATQSAAMLTFSRISWPYLE